MDENYKSHRSVLQQNIREQLHTDNLREGPGDAGSTRRAFSLLTDLPPDPNILDIGCGPGMQTVEVAQLIGNGRITALDLKSAFLEELSRRAKSADLDDKVVTVQGSMFDLPYPPDSFDAIWCEGAIFIIGFEKGLNEWAAALKPRGYLAATHLSWLKTNIPDEPKRYWAKAYPAITSVEQNLEIANRAGYEQLGHFTLPQSAWWTDYYTPMERKIAKLKGKYADDPVAMSILERSHQESDLYRKYASCYGYVFYVMRKKT
jgi:ubiquinone/menaquinone biosynthesis C-methylase UbiE